MSRATILLILILFAIVAALFWLSHRSAGVPTRHVEKVVTLNGAADASKN